MGFEPFLLTCLGVSWLAGLLILSRITRSRASKAPRGSPSPPRTLSVIIPARNEAANLPRLLGSLRDGLESAGRTHPACLPQHLAQGTPAPECAGTTKPDASPAASAEVPGAHQATAREILVVDDASTDGTAEVARQHGARVVEAGALPPGWRGKTWACHQGAEASSGDLLLFLDADTWLEPGGLERLLACHRGGATSVAPWHVVPTPVEQLSAFFNLLMVAGTVPDGLFGQVLLIDRGDYHRIGGHAAVRECILENFHLAAKLRDAGVRVTSFAGRGLVAFRMYPGGFRELIEGWTKGFASGAKGTPKPVLAMVAVWFGGLILTVGAVSLAPWGPVFYLLHALQLSVMLRQAGGFRWWTSLFYPLPLLFYLLVFAASWFRGGKQVKWKGRTIDAA